MELKNCRCGMEITNEFIKPPLIKVPRGYLANQAKYMTETECPNENCKAKIRLFLKPQSNTYKIIRREVIEFKKETVDHKGRIQELEITPEKIKTMKRPELIEVLRTLNLEFELTSSNATKIEQILGYIETGIGEKELDIEKDIEDIE